MRELDVSVVRQAVAQMVATVAEAVTLFLLQTVIYLPLRILNISENTKPRTDKRAVLPVAQVKVGRIPLLKCL